MSNDIQLQLVERLQSSTFAIQLDESTDIAGQAQLLVYVRYCFDNDVVEDFLFCKPVPLRTTGEDLFAMLNDFFIANKLEWSSCIGICTDGAAAMTGHKSGVVARVRTVSPNIISTHCMIHREALASKNLNESFGEVLNTCIKLVNWIKCRPLNGRLFAALCEESGSDHRHLLLHTEVRWLSRGKVLQRVFELRSELASFLMDKNSELVKFVSDNVWLAKLAYLADIFCQLNALNTSLQGRDSSMLKTTDKVKVKSKVFQTGARPVMMYGIETWTVKGEQKKKLIVAKLGMLRANKKYPRRTTDSSPPHRENSIPSGLSPIKSAHSWKVASDSKQALVGGQTFYKSNQELKAVN
ncbi:protein FAM200A-like [Erpetoichthys calabaricus]|uniref:protein FAM200A-like n=1 Tax=Erpetoichthys calabaricus TaxID=27687 RepID=UPI0022348E87|nr:protein FAM200A-like [Erpetoichthys calabaricus]